MGSRRPGRRRRPPRRTRATRLGWSPITTTCRGATGRPRGAGRGGGAASPYLSDLLCVVLDHSNLSEDDRAALRRRLGGRVAFDWRSTPETIVFGAFPHDDS